MKNKTPEEQQNAKTNAAKRLDILQEKLRERVDFNRNQAQEAAFNFVRIAYIDTAGMRTELVEQYKERAIYRCGLARAFEEIQNLLNEI